MGNKARLITVLTLLVTFLVAGLVPAAGSWSCPDGTACVYTRGPGLHCVGDRRAMPCCQAGQQRHGCSFCRHGMLPGIGAAGAHLRAMGEPARCRYQKAHRLGPVWAPVRSGRWAQSHAVALQPAPSRAPVLPRLAARLVPIRGSPPSSPGPSLTAPRGPPSPAGA